MADFDVNELRRIPSFYDSEGEHMDLDNQFLDGMFKFEKIMNGGRK